MVLSLHGHDVGTSVDFRSAGRYTLVHDWPADTRMSAGKGVVFAGEETYGTLFLEAYPPQGGFLRGEGSTPRECEDTAWAQYELSVGCTNGAGDHHFVPGGYRNGAGVCSACGTFRTDLFTGADLGQFCGVCGEGTTYSYNHASDTWGCREHPVKDDSTHPLSVLLRELLDEDVPDDEQRDAGDGGAGAVPGTGSPAQPQSG